VGFLKSREVVLQPSEILLFFGAKMQRLLSKAQVAPVNRCQITRQTLDCDWFLLIFVICYVDCDTAAIVILFCSLVKTSFNCKM